MRLHVNKEGINREFIKCLRNELEKSGENLKKDIERYSGDFGKQYGFTSTEIRKVNKGFIIYLIVNKATLADSFGTGSLMASVSENPGLREYLRSDEWNGSRPRRAKSPIMGRKAGSYTSLTGKTYTTSGSRRGQNIEYQKYIPQHEHGWLEIKPMSPSNSINRAIDWYYSDWLPQAVNNAIKNMNYSKYLEYR